jgi:hypothetical protein
VSFLGLCILEVPLMLQSIHIANCRSVEHILKHTAVFETASHLRNESFGNVHSKKAAVDPAIKNMAKMLSAFAASRAVLPNAPGTGEDSNIPEQLARGRRSVSETNY